MEPSKSTKTLNPLLACPNCSCVLEITTQLTEMSHKIECKACGQPFWIDYRGTIMRKFTDEDWFSALEVLRNNYQTSD